MASLPILLLDLLLWSTVLAVVAIGAAYVLRKIRAGSAQQELTASQLMSKFRDLHSKGELSDAEFRTIRTTLAARMQEEIKDNGQRG